MPYLDRLERILGEDQLTRHDADLGPRAGSVGSDGLAGAGRGGGRHREVLLRHDLGVVCACVCLCVCMCGGGGGGGRHRKVLRRHDLGDGRGWVRG